MYTPVLQLCRCCLDLHFKYVQVLFLSMSFYFYLNRKSGAPTQFWACFVVAPYLCILLLSNQYLVLIKYSAGWLTSPRFVGKC